MLAQDKEVEKYLSLYSFYDRDANNIEVEGCKYLSKAEWPLLEFINLSNSNTNEGWNKIQEKGIIYLTKANWTLLKNA